MLYIKQLLHFTYEQALSCLFPVVIFLTLALSKNRFDSRVIPLRFHTHRMPSYAVGYVQDWP